MVQILKCEKNRPNEILGVFGVKKADDADGVEKLLTANIFKNKVNIFLVFEGPVELHDIWMIYHRANPFFVDHMSLEWLTHDLPFWDHFHGKLFDIAPLILPSCEMDHTELALAKCFYIHEFVKLHFSGHFLKFWVVFGYELLVAIEILRKNIF